MTWRSIERAISPEAGMPTDHPDQPALLGLRIDRVRSAGPAGERPDRDRRDDGGDEDGERDRHRTRRVSRLR